ncbi:MAG: pyruvate formate lyase family protein, partial [Planctomycetota bacterium]|nr:pyruvate formate lyase family protein [Planctomycetota bacterium]
MAAALPPLLSGISHRNFGVYTGETPPRRLPAATRALAERYLCGEIGRSMRPAAFALDSSFYLNLPSLNRQCAEAVRLIAEQAPLRLIDGEKLVGAATLREAMCHRVPALGIASVSHTTLGFEKALRIGYRGIRAEIEQCLGRGAASAESKELWQCMLICLDAAAVWHRRYVRAVEEKAAAAHGKDREHWQAVLAALRPVPEEPPRSFREALQALWLLWDFQRLCGNWSGIGRMDKMLGPFLQADLAAGRIDLDEARDLIAHFWIKGCEWITAAERGSGDAQFYQNVVLAGVDEEGNEIANPVTELILDVVEELHISDFPIAVRVSQRTPESLLRRIAAIQRLGGGIVAIYNDDRIIPMLVEFGYPLREARNYANDGCWEILI